MALAPKILVADDDQALSRTLSWILKENGYEVVAIPGGEHLFEHLASDQFDLLLLDIMMPKVDGLQLLQRVKTDPKYQDLPVLMISSMPPEEATVRSLGLGASDFIAKPFRVRELLARVKAHLRVGRELNQARTEARSRSEMVDILNEVASSLKPDEIFQVLVRRVAQGLRISRCSIILAEPGATEGSVVAAYENPTLRNLRIDLRRYPEIRHALDTGELVLAQDVSTDPLYEAIRSAWQLEGRAIPCRSAIALRFSLRSEPAGVFFLRTTDDDLPLNQQDVQFAEQVISAAVRSLERAYELEHAMSDQDELRHLASTDPLTGSLNRRALAEKLEQEMDRAARYASLLTCMMIDIDNFKQINDTYGHLVGDQILRQLAALLKREQRSPDAVARYGGEEFVVLLPETTLAESRSFAERVLRRVADHDFGEPGRPVRVTISIGLASYPDERVTDGESLLRLADTHLYRAKTEGQNRRCPRCQKHFAAPARYCTIDGTPLVEVAFAAPPTPPPAPAIRVSAARPRLSDADRPTLGPEDAARFRSLTGTVLDERYEIGEKIGEGGMSWVYQAVERGTGQNLAIKVLPPRLTRDRDSAERLRREAEIATRFSHPNVCPILRLGETSDGILYLVMPFLPGETLGDYENRVRDVPVADGIAMLVQVCRGLQHAHDLGVIHRDLKPENVMLVPEGIVGELRRAVVMDFGLAKERRAGLEVAQLTQTGIVLGTPEFMSPEQIRGRALDGRSDVYALGVLAFELFTGELPFIGKNAQEMMVARLRGLPRLLREVRPGLPARLEAVINRALALAADDRYQSMDALAAAFESVLQAGVLARLFGRA